MVTSNSRPGEPLNKEERQRVREIAYALLHDTFIWGTSKEGYDFWQDVHQKLHAIADEEQTCSSCGQKLPE